MNDDDDEEEEGKAHSFLLYIRDTLPNVYVGAFQLQQALQTGRFRIRTVRRL